LHLGVVFYYIVFFLRYLKVDVDKVKILKSAAVVIAIIIVSIVTVLPVPASQKDTVVARGDDGFLVTMADVKAMRNSAEEVIGEMGVRPSRKAQVTGAVRVVLFATEALKTGTNCPLADQSEGFARTIALARCYVVEKLTVTELREEAIESYYLVNWRHSVDKETGEMCELDAKMRQRIAKWIWGYKRKIFTDQEYSNLCEKYNVVVTVNGS